MSNAETFAAPINKFVAELPERQNAVYRDAIQMTVQAMTLPKARGGNMPVRDGFLRASVRAVIGAQPPLKTRRPKGDAVAPALDMGDITMVLSGATVEDTVTVAFTMVYAARVNFGFVGQDSLGRTYDQAGAHFVELAAQKWPQIAAQSAMRVQNIVANRAARPGMAALAQREAGL